MALADDVTPALDRFLVALKVGAQASPAVAELVESSNKAIAAGEACLDGVRLDGLRVTDADVEVKTNANRESVHVEVPNGVYLKWHQTFNTGYPHSLLVSLEQLYQ